MAGEKQEVKSVGTSPESSIDPAEVDTIIERQMQVVERLNDELLRTTRIQAIIGAGLVTLISLLDARLFLPQTSNLAYVFGFVFTFLAFIAWYNHLGAARVSYTDLQVGIHSEVGQKKRIEEPDNRGLVRQVYDFLSNAKPHILPTIGTFIGGTLTVSQFKNDLDPEDTESLVACDAAECIRHNNWVLHTREKYVNAVRGHLHWTFFLLITGVLLMVFF